MAYVPGFQHDIFISYAHGDNRPWIDRFIENLVREVKPRLGVEPGVWVDEESLRRDRDFRLEIPQSVETSALFLMLPSPSYIRSQYCVGEECPAFRRTQAARRERFKISEFANSEFALSCPIIQVDNNDHRTLFPGVTDIFFCDDNETFKPGSRRYRDSLSKLVGELVGLLKGMRNHSTPVFMYPNAPGPELTPAYEALRNELSAEGFRILPERQTNLESQLRDAALTVFLLGESYDERARTLTEFASRQQKPWLVWRSPEAAQGNDLKQLAFAGNLERDDSPYLTFLDSATKPAKLKEEVFAFLRPEGRSEPRTDRPKIYLIYNLKDLADKRNAGSILLHYDKEFHFDLPDDLSQRSTRLMKSDGVLLVWGNADAEWCLGEFQAMVQTARLQNRGMCLFDPAGTKADVVQQIRQNTQDLHIAEEFGKFDPARLEAFFDPIRQGWQRNQE